MKVAGTVVFCVSLFLVFLSVSQVAQPIAATVTVKQFVTCMAIDETKSPYEAVDVTDIFFTADPKVYALVVLDQVQPPLTVGITYFRPDGTKLGPTTHKFTEIVGEPVVSYAVYLENVQFSSYTGLWRVEAYADGVLLSTIRFTLSPQGPRLKLTDATIKPGPGEPIYSGDLITATYTLQNTGTTTASNVEIRVVDSPPEVSVETPGPMDLAPRSIGSWHVNMRPKKAGEFRAGLSFFMGGVKQVFRFADGSQKDTFTITLSVSLRPAFLVLQRVVTEPSASEPFYVGDVGTITYSVENAGEMPGRNVEIRVVSAPPEIEVVQVTAPRDLLPSATDEWQLKVRAAEPGTYEIYVTFYVNGEKVIFRVEGQTETVEQFKTTITASERPFLETYGLYLALGLIAIVVIAAAVLAMRRRGRVAPPSAAPAAPTVAPAPPRKFCVNCGTAIPPGTTFCQRCGARQP